MDWLKDPAARRALWKKIEDLILDGVDDAIPGPEKMEKVIANAARWLAERTPLPNVIEIPVYTMLISLPAQLVYDFLKDREDRPLLKASKKGR